MVARRTTMIRSSDLSEWTARGGSITLQVALALVVLVTSAALCFDVGQTVVAAQIAQRTADAAALAGAWGAITGAEAAASDRATSIVAANGATCSYPLAVPPSGIICLGSGSAIPGYRTLTAGEEAITVPVSAYVTFHFAPLFGLNSMTVVRSATVARVHAAGAPIAPMWISNSTPLIAGTDVELHASTAEIEPIPAGNFGWLEPQAGDFRMLLSGYQIPDDIRLANYVQVGDTVDARTGQQVGNWTKTLEDRLARATLPPYSSQTPTEGGYTEDNPRLLTIPLVTVIGGVGTNASFRVERFAVFWLKSVRGGSSKSIMGEFLRYDVPLQPDTAQDTGIWTVRLVD